MPRLRCGKERKGKWDLKSIIILIIQQLEIICNKTDKSLLNKTTILISFMRIISHFFLCPIRAQSMGIHVINKYHALPFSPLFLTKFNSLSTQIIVPIIFKLINLRISKCLWFITPQKCQHRRLLLPKWDRSHFIKWTHAN